MQPVSTQTFTQPPPVDSTTPAEGGFTDQKTDSGYDRGTYAKGTTDWQAGEEEPRDDGYSYSDYEKQGTSDKQKTSPVFPIEDRPEPLLPGSASQAAVATTGGFPTWALLLAAAAGAYLLLKD